MESVKKKRLLKDVTITHVSYVKRGANKKQFFLAKSTCDHADIEFPVRIITKQDDNPEKKLLYGVVYEPDFEDTDGDYMTSDEIEKTAHEFLQYYRNIDTEHNLLAGAGAVVESYIAPVDFIIGKEKIKAGSWVLVSRASDENWEAWKKGEITGYSMFGISRSTRAEKGEKTMKSWIKRVLDSLNLSKNFDEAMDNVLTEMSVNPSFIVDIMQEDFFNNVAWDSATEEQLKVLSDSMKSATDYIDKKIASLKSSEGSQPAGSEDVNTDTEPAPALEKTEASEPEPDLPDVAEIVKSMESKFLQSLTEMEKKFNNKIDEISKSLSETNEKLNENLTDSAVSVPQPVREASPDIRGKGLV
jgi:division protein CdvB (Snf7/Vps24/ESCRT-III family)